MNIIRNICFILVFVQTFIVLDIFANEFTGSKNDYASKDYFIYSSYHRGMLFGHRSFITYYNEDYINGFAFRAGRSFPEIRRERTPKMGMGFYHSNLGNKELFGNTTGLYFFFSSYITQQIELFNLGTTVSAGISYVDNPYDKSDNPANQAIGSSFNSFFILSLDFIYTATNELSFYFSPSLVHMSNGNVKIPNSGLNLSNIQLGLKYTINSKDIEIETPSYHENSASNKNRLSLSGSIGMRQKSLLEYETELLTSTMLEYSYMLSPSFRLGIGGDFFSISDILFNYETVLEEVEYNRYSGGIHLSGEIMWSDLTFVIQQGVRFFHSSHEKPYFSRIGVRYNIGSDFFVNCNLKSHFFVAEYIEVGVGYSLDF